MNPEHSHCAHDNNADEPQSRLPPSPWLEVKPNGQRHDNQVQQHVHRRVALVDGLKDLDRLRAVPIASKIGGILGVENGPIIRDRDARDPSHYRIGCAPESNEDDQQATRVVQQSAFLEDTHVLEEERYFDKRGGHGVGSVENVEALQSGTVSISLLCLTPGPATEATYVEKGSSPVQAQKQDMFSQSCPSR